MPGVRFAREEVGLHPGRTTLRCRSTSSNCRRCNADGLSFLCSNGPILSMQQWPYPFYAAMALSVDPRGDDKAWDPIPEWRASRPPEAPALER